MNHIANLRNFKNKGNLKQAEKKLLIINEKFKKYLKMGKLTS